MMTPRFFYAVGAAILYGLHQVFTKLRCYRLRWGYSGQGAYAGVATSVWKRSM